MPEITRSALGPQLRTAQIGWSRDLKPVPKSGRIRFDDIGNLSEYEHTGATNIDLSDIQRQSVIGEKDKKPIDPADYRGAIWAMGYRINRGENQPPPNIDSWMLGLINQFSGSRSNGIHDQNEEALYLQCDTNSYYYAPKSNTVLVYYAGKIPAGTAIKVTGQVRADNTYRYGEGVYSQVRGWPNGWFGEGDYTNYVQNYQRRTRGEYIDVEEEFTVRAGYEDIWVAFECQSNDPKYNGGDLNRGYWRNWKLELA